MNRQQRRQQAKLGVVDLREVVMPHNATTKECLQMATWRINDNLRDAKYPTYHLTANGAIVDADPTLEFLMKRLEKENPDFYHVVDEYIQLHLRSITEKPKAIPVNRKYYGHDPFERH